MKIDVKHIENEWRGQPYVSAGRVVIGFACPHNQTHLEERDFGYYSPEHEDVVDDWQEVPVCDECGEALWW